MWTTFTILYDGVEYLCEAKVYDKPSTFGIRHGRVSKLYVKAKNLYDGTEMAGWEYDRGWPEDKDGRPVQAPEWFIDKLMRLYPETTDS